MSSSTPYPPSPAESSLATSIFSLPSKASSEAEQRAARVASWQFATQVVAVDSSQNQYGASSTPIFQTATFKGMEGPYDYTRSGNPTRGGLESHLARLYGATQCFALSTGMTCLDIILRLVKPGETVLAGDDLYGGTNRLLTYVKTHGGVDVRHVDTTSVEAVLPHLGPGNKVKMVLLESPTNPLLKIADIVEITTAVKSASPDAIVVVDNTMMSPYLQRPLELGVDIVYDSATKYLSGHHDLMAGIIAVGPPGVAKDIAWLINAVGSGLAPFDSFLLLRGIKTLALRMDKQQSNAELIAAYLDALGFLVHYPGLKTHPKRDVHFRQATGAGAVLSFVTDDKALSERIVGAARLWGISVSFGAVNSLISMPCLMSHASISAAVRAERGLPENLIRLCVGIEDPRDLLEDLEHALIVAGAITPAIDSSILSEVKLAELYKTSPEQWAIERARAFRRPGSAVDELVEGVSKGLALSSEPKTIEEDIVVSAPGKVILFGEHAVVHGVTAIATSVNLRCFGVLSSRTDAKVALEAPNLEAELTWDIASLPWQLVPSRSNTPSADSHLDPSLLTAIEEAVSLEAPSKRGISACVAFLYVYMSMAGNQAEALSVTLTVSANLPIGAGLGSSAAFSTCVASALLAANSHIAPENSTFSIEHVDLVDAWAFIAEKVLHGNPSGIDNAVSVRGGAVAFTRAVAGNPGGLEGIRGFGSIRLLLTNTCVPRDTKSLVAGVSAKRIAEPEVVDPILAAIQAISDEARGLLEGSQPIARESFIARLETLMRENHAHLVELGVSHSSLETIVATTAAQPFGLATKLTGAGGGGCAVTLIPDDFPATSLDALVDVLTKLGFEPHLTSLGVPGFGILMPSEPAQSPAASLRATSVQNLTSWSTSLSGQWCHT